MRKELERASVALDDWLNTYASEFCDEKRVQEAQQRIMDSGGTLAYIADLQEAIREALNKPVVNERNQFDELNSFTRHLIETGAKVRIRNGEVHRIRLYEPECDTEEEFFETVDENGEPNYQRRWHLCGKSIQRGDYDMMEAVHEV